MLATESQTRDRGPHEDLETASKGLKAVGVRVYAVGIGRFINQQQLFKIASHPKFVFQAQNFNVFQNSVEKIKKSICKGKTVSN